MIVLTEVMNHQLVNRSPVVLENLVVEMVVVYHLVSGNRYRFDWSLGSVLN